MLRRHNGARVALAVIVNLEHWDWEIPPGTPLPVSSMGGPDGLWTGNQSTFPQIPGSVSGAPAHSPVSINIRQLDIAPGPSPTMERLMRPSQLLD